MTKCVECGIPEDVPMTMIETCTNAPSVGPHCKECCPREVKNPSASPKT